MGPRRSAGTTARRRTTTTALLAALSLFPLAMAGPAVADGACGVVELPVSAVDSAAEADGSVVVLLSGRQVTRYAPDGRLDSSFGDGGVRSLDDVHPDDTWEQIGLLAHDDRLVSVGRSGAADAPILLVGLTRDGDADLSFGRRGVARLPVPGGYPLLAAAAPDGSSVVVVREYGSQRWGLARVSPLGAYVAGGVTWVDAGLGAGPKALALRGDGSALVLLEDAGAGEGSLRGPGVAAVDPTGAPVAGFGQAGVALLPFDGLSTEPGVLADADGGLVVPGYRASDGQTTESLVRLTADGLPDTAFGVDGSASLPGSGGWQGRSDLARDGDGRLLVARTWPAQDPAVRVTRLGADGAADRTFGVEGTVLLRPTYVAGPISLSPVPGGTAVTGGGDLLLLDEQGAVATDCPQPGDPDVVRLAGTDRYATAVEVSRWAFPRGAGTVFVATAGAFPDALAAVPAATRAEAPLLLVQKDAVPAVVQAELARLAPARIVVLGGTAAVSDGVLTALRAAAPQVERIAGADRFATAAAVSAATFDAGVDEVFVATGMDFPDALAGGAAAGLLDIPILLVTRDAVPAATARELSRLRPGAITVLGGPAAVSDEVAEDLAALSVDGAYPERLEGASRYATASAIASIFDAGTEYDGAPSGASTVFLATGADFPDALAAGSAAAHTGSPLVLVPRAELLDVVRERLTLLAAPRVVVLGGASAVSDAVVAGIQAPGALRHVFAARRNDREPLRWNPCEPLAWVWNPAGAPSGALADVQAAVSSVSAATGIPFRYEGVSDEPGRTHSGFWQLQSRYGHRPAPVLVAFGGQEDRSGWAAVGSQPDGSDDQIISGFITMSGAKDWVLGGGSDATLVPALERHLALVLGLEESPFPEELMHPSASSGKHFGPGDLAGLRTLGTGSGCLTPGAELVADMEGI